MSDRVTVPAQHLEELAMLRPRIALLQGSEARYQTLVEQSLQGILITRHGRLPSHRDNYWLTKDGRRHLIAWSHTQVLDTTGVVTYVIATGIDVTERRYAEDAVRWLNASLEQRVQERTAQLEAANKDLEAFSYSVSHDLRAPLRAINGFSRILLDEYAPTLAAGMQHYLQHIPSGTQHIGQLIDDLLAFTRLSRQPLDKRVVSPMSLSQHALEMLQHECDGRQVDIHIAPLLVCHADAKLLQQVFVNLLANALKFTRRRPVARLEIGCQERSGERVYFVRDNGTGFDMRYGYKWFGVFQRFHRAEDYEGTGVGLAIVQRIAHRHGGRVWVQAEVERGATFFYARGGASHG